MAALIGAAIGEGQSSAQNPNASVGGSGGLGLNHWDPIGNFITSKGGDPWNLYGHKNNPGALFFPSGSNDSGNITLPPPSGQIHPNFYNPNSFVNRPLTGGYFNQMSQHLAGPMYNPQVLRPNTSQTANPTGVQNPTYGNPSMYGGLEQGDTSHLGLMQQYKQGQNGKGTKGASYGNETPMTNAMRGDPNRGKH